MLLAASAGRLMTVTYEASGQQARASQRGTRLGGGPHASSAGPQGRLCLWALWASRGEPRRQRPPPTRRFSRRCLREPRPPPLAPPLAPQTHLPSCPMAPHARPPPFARLTRRCCSPEGRAWTRSLDLGVPTAPSPSAV